MESAWRRRVGNSAEDIGSDFAGDGEEDHVVPNTSLGHVHRGENRSHDAEYALAPFIPFGRQCSMFAFCSLHCRSSAGAILVSLSHILRCDLAERAKRYAEDRSLPTFPLPGSQNA
jgi:hypothetical protein